MTKKQKGIISRCLHAGRPADIVRKAKILAERERVELPSRMPILEEIRRQVGAEAVDLPRGVTHVVDHAHLLIPLENEDGELSRGVVCCVIEVASGDVVGISLGFDRPRADRVADAFDDGVRRVGLDAIGTILVDHERTQEWTALISNLSEKGLRVLGETLPEGAFDGDEGILRKRGNGRTVLAYAGRKLAGYKLRIRSFGERQMGFRPPKVQARMTLEEGVALIRARLDGEITS